MELWRGTDAVPAGLAGCVLTIGNFDGVHRGHQALIAEAVEAGRTLALPTVVLTFDPHPAAVLQPDQQPAMLTSPHRRGAYVILDQFQAISPALSRRHAHVFRACLDTAEGWDTGTRDVRLIEAAANPGCGSRSCPTS